MRRDRKNDRHMKAGDSEFDHRVIHIARVTRVVKGGRRFRFRATVVIGDHKGRVGCGVAKGADVASAIDKAKRVAKKELVTVAITNGTIPHEVQAKFGGAHVLLKPGAAGSGIIAGGAVRIIAELLGITDLVAKMFGSAHPLNNCRAVLKAFGAIRTKEEIMKARGKAATSKPKSSKK